MAESELIFKFTGEIDRNGPSEIDPTPSYEFKPDWFRQLPAIYDEGDPSGTTVKLDRTFTDPFNMGYIIPIPEEIKIGRHGKSVEGILGEHHVEPCDIHIDTEAEKTPPPTTPNAIINLPWSVELPDDYGLLVTDPFNRSFGSERIFDLFIPGEEIPEKLPIPINIPEGVTTFTSGQSFVQVVPMHQPSLDVDVNVLTKSDCEGFEEEFQVQLRRQVANPRDYRENSWRQKCKPTVSNGNDDMSVYNEQLKPINDKEYLSVLEAEKGRIFPTPQVSNSDFLNIQFGSSTVTPSTSNLVNWIKTASEIGLIYKIPFDIELSVNPYRDNSLGVQSPYSDSSGKRESPIQTVPIERIGIEAIPNLLCYYDIKLHWKTIAPPGYSTLFCEPLNRHPTDVRLFTKLIDNGHNHHQWTSGAGQTASNRYNHIDSGVMQGYIRKNGGQRVVELSKNKPIVQLIPLRRDSLLTNAVIKY